MIAPYPKHIIGKFLEPKWFTAMSALFSFGRARTANRIISHNFLSPNLKHV